jgi:hypothetical protein
VEEKQPPEPKPVDEIRVSGTTSVASCSVMDDAGQRSVDIPVPGSEKIKAGWTTIVGATCQKAGAQGSLKTEIVIDGKVEASQSTSAEFGVVTVTYPQ